MEKFDSVITDMGYKRIKDNLRKNYYQALDNAIFKMIVEHLNMDEKKLINCTSTIEDCCHEYEHCLKCKSLLACKNKIEGYVYTPENVEGQLEFNYVACKYQKKHLKDNTYLDNISLFEMNKDTKNSHIKDVYVDDKNRFKAIKATNDFIANYKREKKGKGIYLTGNFGCGKTYLISAAFNELAKSNVKSAIVFYPEFLRDLKSSFGTSFNEKFEIVKKAPLLLIDDIGAEAVTLWSRDEILSPILQYRMQESLPTFFTSNLTIKELEEHLSLTKGNVDLVKARRIIERINFLTLEIPMISKNLR